MGNFNRSNSSGGRGNRSFSNSRSDRPEMFHATCADCGKDCMVPFRPSGDKPVYCSDCFGGKSDSAPRRSDSRGFDSRRSSSRGSDSRRSDSRRFDSRRSDSGERSMHSAVCDECGKTCEVPFKPTGDKPIYCNDCFGGKGNSRPQSSGQSNKQIEAMNEKLDKVIALLGKLVPEAKEEKPKAEKKESPIKNTKKKEVKPKASEKKEVKETKVKKAVKKKK